MIERARDWFLSWGVLLEGIPAKGFRVFLVTYSVVVLGAYLVQIPAIHANPLDRTVSQWAHDHPKLRGSWAARLTKLGDGAFVKKVTWISLGILLLARRWRYAPLLFIGVLGMLELNPRLQVFIARPRPSFPDMPDLLHPGFPSGHTAGAAALYFFWILFVLAEIRSRPWRLILITILSSLILAVMVTRVTLLAHWPSDTLAGVSVSVAWLLVWFWLNPKLFAISAPGQSPPAAPANCR